MQHAALGADPVDDGVVGVPDVLEPVPAELDLEGEGGGVDDDRPGDDAVEEPGEVLGVLRVGLLPAGLARVVVVLPLHPGDPPPDPEEPEDRRVAGPVVDRNVVGLCPSRRLVEDVLALVPQVVDCALCLDPEPQDEPLVPEARVLRPQRRLVLLRERRVVVEGEVEDGRVDIGVLDVVGVQPVERAVGVRGDEHLCAGQGEPGAEHPEVGFRQDRRLVDVGADQGHAPDLLLGPLVVRAGNVAEPAGDRALPGVAPVTELVLSDDVLDRPEDVTVDGPLGLAADQDVARGSGGDELQKPDDGGDGLGRPDRSMPDIEPPGALADGPERFGGEPVPLNRHVAAPP